MCKKCEIKPVYELTNKRKFCRECFCRYFEKKVLYTIRKYSMFKNTEKIFVVSSNAKGKIIFNILKRICEKNNIAIKKVKKCVNMKKYEKIAVEHSLDDGAFLIVLEIMKKSQKLNLIGPNLGNCIKPLYFCLDKEIVLYAKIKGIKGKVITEEKDKLKLKIISFINFMEKKHPEIKNAIVNSLLEIMPALK